MCGVAGADPNAQFRVELKETSGNVTAGCFRPMFWRETRAHDALVNAANGRSLLSAAFQFLPFPCVETLLRCGARFLPTDPHPLCTAFGHRPMHAQDVVRLFFNYSIRDVLPQPSALHMLFDLPLPQHMNPWETVTRMLLMGFSHSTQNAEGITALQYAEARLAADRGNTFLDCMTNRLRLHQRQIEGRGLAIAAVQAIDRHLPPDIRDYVGKMMPGPSMRDAARAIVKIRRAA